MVSPGRDAISRWPCGWRTFAAWSVALTLTGLLRASPAPVELSERAPLAAHALLLDAVNADGKIIAVGDHGIVVISRDDGRTWTQSITPTRALLTAVSFPDAGHGWAVGHDGVILATSDGGKTWRHQDDGKDPDTVFLDVRFLDRQRGFAVGAYGKFLSTADGGETWQPAGPSADDVHYNRLSVGDDGCLYLAGESGTLLTSRDGGKKWQASNVPYDGSLFGALPLGNGVVLAYGLRGHIFRSDDRGVAWEPKTAEVPVLIMTGIRLKSGTVLLGGQGGNFFVSRNDGKTFEPWKPSDFGTGVSAMVETRDGALIIVGEAGAVRINQP